MRVRAATGSLVLVVTVAVASAAQTPAPPPFTLAGPAFLAVRVADVERAAAWYASTFRLEEVNRLRVEDGSTDIRILTGHGLSVELIQERSAERAAEPHLGHFKAGLYVADLGAFHRYLRDAGVDTDARIFVDEALEARSFVFRDPEGNRLQAFERCDGPCRETVRILAYNIHHGEGMDGVLDLERIAALITSVQPDLVALQEIDRSVERTEIVDQAAVLGELTGLTPVFGDFMPYQGGHYGMAVLTQWPVVAVANHRLPDGDEPRSALAVRVRSPESGRELSFVGIHLYRTAAERLAQAQALAERLAPADVPVILAGDFNSEPDSEVIAFLSRSWHFIDKGADRLTFSSFAPEREIDFVAYRPAEAFTVASQRLLDEPVASDHRPLFVELRW